MNGKSSVVLLLSLLFLLFATAVFAQGSPSLSAPAGQPAGAPAPGKASSEATAPALKAQQPPAGERKAGTEGPNAKASRFEEYISGGASATLSTDIRQFGYDLFQNPPSTFAPVQNVPVGPDYVMGPGDEIRVAVWGRVEANWDAVVDNDGNITLPKLGVLGVTGLTFRELKDLLRTEVAKYYAGFEMNVSMGSLRTIRVYVVGNAQRPGAYTISALSTVINALFESGGPSKIGTMRDIQVKRNGKTAVHLDLYDFLLSGDKTKDIRLMPEDVIFIPPVGPLAGIAGNVRNPAIYELKGETRLLDLIGMAGGLTGIAFQGRVQMQRIEDHQYLTLFEGDLVDIEKNRDKNFLLQDGDLAKVYAVVDSSRTVTVAGAVAYPGAYGVTPGVTTVKDVVSLAGGTLYYASNQGELTRVTVTAEGPKTEIRNIDIRKALDGDPESNLTLATNDYLLIKTVPEWRLYRTVSIAGEVKYPGTYTVRKDERLSSLIERAGGFTERAYLRGAVFTRERVRVEQQARLDEIARRMESELLSTGTAQIGEASSSEEAKILQLELDQKRRFVEQLKSMRAKGRIALTLSDPAALKDSAYDIELEQGDSLQVPSDPKTVQVLGAVFNPSAFIYRSGKAYGYYVDLSGGYSRNADDGNVWILQAGGTAARPGGIFGSNDLFSGYTVVVPEKLDRYPWMRQIKDLTQILYQIAVTAGVLIVVF